MVNEIVINKLEKRNEELSQKVNKIKQFLNMDWIIKKIVFYFKKTRFLLKYKF